MGILTANQQQKERVREKELLECGSDSRNINPLKLHN